LSGEAADFLGDDTGVTTDRESRERHRHEHECETKECPAMPPPAVTDGLKESGYVVVTHARKVVDQVARSSP
jgi:hypothetical protein